MNNTNQINEIQKKINYILDTITEDAGVKVDQELQKLESQIKKLRAKEINKLKK